MADQKSLNQLLRWSVEQTPAPDPSNPNPTPPERRTDLDPGVIDAILGKPDAQKMKEWVELIRQSTTSKEDREVAWDELEMLVESLDNANDLESTGLWQPIIDRLTKDDEGVYDDDDVMHACWVCGTAVQNNLRSQTDFLKRNPLPTILKIITSRSTKISTRAKAIYCLSSTLKHNAAAIAIFDKLDGWGTLAPFLKDNDQTIRNKVSFLLFTLIAYSTPPSTDGGGKKLATDPEAPVHPSFNPDPSNSSNIDATNSLALLDNLRKANIIDIYVESLKTTDQNEQLDDTTKEHFTRSLAALVEYSSPAPPAPSIFNFGINPLTPDERKQIASALQTERQRLQDNPDAAEFSLTTQEWDKIESLLS